MPIVSVALFCRIAFMKSLFAFCLLAVIPSITIAANQQSASHKSDKPPQTPLQFSKWSGTVNVPDPVAISFDNLGQAYVTQTRRRKLQDLDIRQHREWIADDVGLQSVEQKRSFYRSQLAIGNDTANRKHVRDLNQDGYFDFRDLTAISERIHLIRDTDEDGTADAISVFAENFQNEVTGIAAGVLHHDGHVYTTVAPDVWKLTDTDNDGTENVRARVATGFGLHIAYAGHDMHGLTVGPDGKIYWSIGDKGISARSQTGERFHFPNQGGVMRCNPDGSDFEVFAHGLRNVQEPTFDQFGNLFGVDNDADKSGERERFVWIVKGMDAGWRCNYQYRGDAYDPWMKEKMSVPYQDGQPACIVPPISLSIDGPAGCAFNPGTALSPEYRDYFFLTGAPGGVQIAFQVQPQGDSFAMINNHKIGNGIPLVGISFAPDGGLYGVDWGGGYPLNQKGAVWKIDAPASANSKVRQQVQQLLRAGFDEKSNSELKQLLAHADQRIRLNAQFALVKRGAVDELKITATSAQELLARIHAIWGLGQIARIESGSATQVNANANAARDHLQKLLNDKNPQVLKQVLRTIGDLQEFAGRALIPLVGHADQHVQFAAIQALADHPEPSALPALFERLRQLKRQQTYLRFALARALSTCATPEQLAEFVRRNDATDLMHLVAVVALRMQKSGRVRDFLKASEQVATEAARAIHDDFSIVPAMPDLAAALESAAFTNEAFVRRAINANFRLGRLEDLERLASYAANTDKPTPLRLEALRAINDWIDPNPLDRVTGRYRYFVRNLFTPASIREQVSKIVTDDNPQLRAASLSAAARLNLNVEPSALIKLIKAKDSAVEVRVAALNALHAQQPESVSTVLPAALQAKPAALRIRALELQVESDAAAGLLEIERILTQSTSVTERQSAVIQLGRLGTLPIGVMALRLLRNHDAASNQDIALEVLETSRKLAKNDATVKAELDRRDKAVKSSRDPLADFRECLQGGDAKRGEQIFKTHLSAQCIRCHRIGKTGSRVGPRLDDIGKKRNPDHLLRAIVAPSADIEEKYRTRVVVLDSGKVIQGVLTKQDKVSITLADTNGKETRILTDDIDESSEKKTSIMPEMVQEGSAGLTKREIRDLVAFLKTLKKTR